MKLTIVIDVADADVDPLNDDPHEVAAEVLADLDGADRFAYDGPQFAFVSAEWGDA